MTTLTWAQLLEMEKEMEDRRGSGPARRTMMPFDADSPQMHADPDWTLMLSQCMILRQSKIINAIEDEKKAAGDMKLPAHAAVHDPRLLIAYWWKGCVRLNQLVGANLELSAMLHVAVPKQVFSHAFCQWLFARSFFRSLATPNKHSLLIWLSSHFWPIFESLSSVHHVSSLSVVVEKI